MGVIVVFWLALSLAVGLWASSRGRSALGWMLFALVLSPLLAAIFVAVLPDRAPREGQPTEETHVACPDCAELIRREARVCRYCGFRLKPGLDA